MNRENLVAGWSLLSDYKIERFRPEPDPRLPAPMSEATDAYNCGFITFSVAGPNVMFRDDKHEIERYAVINCDIPSMHYVWVKTSAEYEMDPSALPVSFEWAAGTVEIDLGTKQISVVKQT